MGAAKKIDKSASDLFLEKAIKEELAVKQEMSIKRLTVDQGLQSRVQNDIEHEMHLASQLDEGYELKAIVVFYDRKLSKWWVADGFHRVAAYMSRKRPSIWAYVIEGTIDDAILFSVSANLWQGKSTGREDRKKATFMMFGNETHQKMSDAAIANRCGISANTAAKYRVEYVAKTGTALPETIVTSNGRVQSYRQANRGKRVVRSTVSGNGGKLYHVQYDGDKFVSADKAKVEQHIASKEGLVESKRRALDLASIRDFLARNDLYCKTIPDFRHHRAGLCGFCVNDTAVVALAFEKGDDFPLAIGRLDMLDASFGSGLRKVVVCYPEDGPQGTIELMRAYGVEFLTPDELVASLKGDADESELN